MKTSEMITALEKNPKLKFKGDKWIDGSVLQLDEEGHVEIVSYSGNRISAETVLAYIPSRINWQLIREPVPVWEAIKALVSDKQTIRGVNRYGEFTITPNQLESSQPLAVSNLKDCLWYVEDSPNA